MQNDALQPRTTWAEDRATQRCDPSAVPGAKTGAGARSCLVPLPFDPNSQSTKSLRDWQQSDKPSWHDAATLWQDARFNSLTPIRQDSNSR